MSTISLRLPDSLHEAAREEAKKDKVSINQLVATALAEKLSALKTADYLAQRGKRAPNRRRFKQLLGKAPSVKPARQDRF